MAPTHTTLTPPPAFSTTTDARDRHEWGVSKSRKTASTGGGRAWSEEEESYLLQTRMQKMPYKEIAAHLKKTDLACRLHYHQLSHASNRRKRTASCSSGSSTHQSPPPRNMSSPAHVSHMSRSITPPDSAASMMSSSTIAGHGMQLPRIISHSSPPRLPAILPKPMAMTYSMSGDRSPRPMPSPMRDPYGLQPAVTIDRRPSLPSTPSLRMANPLPRPSESAQPPTHVDLHRLHSVYAAHRNAFWSVIAHEYGRNTHPAALENAWRTGVCCSQHAESPITPVASPDNSTSEQPMFKTQDRTRISAILGADTDTRSAWDHDMVRRL